MEIQLKIRKKMRSSNPLTLNINTNNKFDIGERMCIKVEKLSGRSLFFNERILYADEKEIRYYSKVRKNWLKIDS